MSDDAVPCVAMSVRLAGPCGLRCQCNAAAPRKLVLPSPQSVWCCGVMQSMILDCLLLRNTMASLDMSKLCHAGIWQALTAANFCRVATCQWPAQVTGNWQKAEQLAGRLRLCSKSLFFDADDARAPIIRCAMPPDSREAHCLAAALIIVL